VGKPEVYVYASHFLTGFLKKAFGPIAH